MPSRNLAQPAPVLLLLGCAALLGAELRAQDSQPQSKPTILVAQEGGALTTPTTLFTAAAEHKVRDQVIVAVGDRLHLYVVTTDAKASACQLHHAVSQNKGRSWSKPEKLTDPRLDKRSAWVKGYALGKQILLVIATNPDLGPQTPRIGHFMGKNYQSFMGVIQVLRFQQSDHEFLGQVSVDIENPGKTIFAHHAFRPAWTLVAHGSHLTLTGTTWFPHQTQSGRTRVWSLVVSHSEDDGKTFGKVCFQAKAYPGLGLLKPAFLAGKSRVHAVFGDAFDRNLVYIAADGKGKWEKAESDLGKLSQANFWYDGVTERDAVVVTDTVVTKKKPLRYGIVEFESKDNGKTWQRRRTIDLDMPKAYAALSQVRDRMRAHVAWDVAALSADDGKTWLRTTLPAAFRVSHSMLIPNRGLAFSAVAEKNGRACVQLVIYSM